MKFIKLTGRLYLVGNGGLTKFEPMGEFDAARKTGYNTLAYGVGLSGAWLKETVEEIQEIIEPSLSKVTEVTTSDDLSLGCARCARTSCTCELPF